MKYSGLLLKESLKDPGVLALIHVTKQEIWSDIKNAAPDQPTTWTALSFELEGSENEISRSAERFSQNLRDKWYLNMSSGDTIYVVFPNRVFRYAKGDGKTRSAAVEYGRQIGIPESQLDWGD